MVSTGCECCCECKDEEVGELQINITGFIPYNDRNSTTTCPYPDPNTSFLSNGGNMIPFITSETTNSGTNSDNFLTAANYYLWVEFKTCCENLRLSEEFVKLSNEGLAYAVQDAGGNSQWKYIFALNVNSSGSSVTIPFPTSSNVGVVPAITLHYYEPCTTTCAVTKPCSDGVSYRPYWVSSVPIPSVSGKTRELRPIDVILAFSKYECSTPYAAIPTGYYCN